MTVDATQFRDLPEEMRWEVLRTLELADIARMAETNTDFRDTVSAMFENRTDIAERVVQKEVQQNDATAMDLQARFNVIFGDEPWVRSFWENSVLSQEVAIMENIERRLDLRGYGENSDDAQLWSAIEDMYLLRPERALEWLQRFEEHRPGERLERIDAGEAQPDNGDIWPEARSVTYSEFVSAAREMFERRGEFFVEPDGSEIGDRTYASYIYRENQSPGYILRDWASGGIQIREG